MDKNILLDLANETVRRYGDLDPDFPEKMARRIKRKFSVKVETQIILEYIFHYKEIYGFAASILKEYLMHPKGKYADPRDVDVEKFLHRLSERYPDEDNEILEKISGWVVYYEYLR